MPPLNLTLRNESLSVQHNVTCILDGVLYLGGDDVSDDSSALTDLKITHVVNCTTECPNYFPKEFRYLQLKIKDSDDANILAPFEEVYAFVEEARRNSGACLLHCIAGMSRSASLVIAYVMRRDSLSLLAAVEFVKARRPMVSPNVGFMRQLIDHERAATGTVSVDIDAYAADRFGHPDGYRIR